MAPAPKKNPTSQIGTEGVNKGKNVIKVKKNPYAKNPEPYKKKRAYFLRLPELDKTTGKPLLSYDKNSLGFQSPYGKPYVEVFGEKWTSEDVEAHWKRFQAVRNWKFHQEIMEKEYGDVMGQKILIDHQIEMIDDMEAEAKAQRKQQSGLMNFFGSIGDAMGGSSRLDERRRQINESMHYMAVNSWKDEANELEQMFRELGVDADGKPIQGKEQKIYIPELEDPREAKPVIKEKKRSRELEEEQLTKRPTLDDGEDLEINIGFSETDDPFRDRKAREEAGSGKPKEMKDIGALSKKMAKESEERKEDMILSPGASIPVVAKFTAMVKKKKPKDNEKDPDEYETVPEEKDHPLRALVEAANTMMAAWQAIYEGELGIEKYNAFVAAETALLQECDAAKSALTANNPDNKEMVPNLDYVEHIRNDVVRADHLALGRQISADQAKALLDGYRPGESVNVMSDAGKEPQGENADNMLRDLLTVPMHYEDYARGVRTLYLYVKRLIAQGVAGLGAIDNLLDEVGGMTMQWEYIVEDTLGETPEEFARMFPGAVGAAEAYKALLNGGDASKTEKAKKNLMTSVLKKHRFRFGAYMHKFLTEGQGDTDRAAYVLSVAGKAAFGQEDFYGIAENAGSAGRAPEGQAAGDAEGDGREEILRQMDDLLLRPVTIDIFHQESALLFDRVRRFVRFGVKGLSGFDQMAKAFASLQIDWEKAIEAASGDAAGFEAAFPGSKELRDRWIEISQSEKTDEEKKTDKQALIPQFQSKNALVFFPYARELLRAEKGEAWKAFAARYGEDGDRIPSTAPLHIDDNYEYERFHAAAKNAQSELRFLLTTTVTIEEFKTAVQGLHGNLEALKQENDGKVDPKMVVTNAVVEKLVSFAAGGKDNVVAALWLMPRGERRHAFGEIDAEKNLEAIGRWNGQAADADTQFLDRVRLDFGVIALRYFAEAADAPAEGQDGLSKEDLLSFLRAVVTDNREHPEGEEAPELSSARLWELEAQLDTAIARAHPEDGSEPQKAYREALLNTEKTVLAACRKIVADEKAGKRLVEEAKKLMLRAAAQDFADRGLNLQADDEMLRQNVVEKADYVPGESKLAVTAEYDANIRKEAMERLELLLPRQLGEEDITPQFLSDWLNKLLVYYNTSASEANRDADGVWALLSFLSTCRLTEAKDLAELASMPAGEGGDARREQFDAAELFEKMDALDALVAQIGYQKGDDSKLELAGTVTVEQVLTHFVDKYGAEAQSAQAAGAVPLQAVWYNLRNKVSRGHRDNPNAQLTPLRKAMMGKYEAIRLWQRARKPVRGYAFVFDPNDPGWTAFLAKAGEVVADCRQLLGGNEDEAQRNRINDALEIILRMDYDLRGIWNVDDGQIRQSLDTYVPGSDRQELNSFEKEVEESLNDVLPQQFEDEQQQEEFKAGYRQRLTDRLGKLLLSPLTYTAFLHGVEKLASYGKSMADSGVQGLEAINGLLAALSTFRVNWVARIDAAAGNEGAFAQAFPATPQLREQWRAITASQDDAAAKLSAKKNLVPAFLQKNAFCYGADVRGFLQAENKAEQLEEFNRLYGAKLQVVSVMDQNYEFERSVEDVAPLWEMLTALFAEPKNLAAIKQAAAELRDRLPQNQSALAAEKMKTVRELVEMIGALALDEVGIRDMVRQMEPAALRELYLEQDEEAGIAKRQQYRSAKGGQAENGVDPEVAFLNDTPMYFAVLVKEHLAKAGKPELIRYMGELMKPHPPAAAGAEQDPNTKSFEQCWQVEKLFERYYALAHPAPDANVPAETLADYKEALTYAEQGVFDVCIPMLADARVTNNRLRDYIIRLLTKVVMVDFEDRGVPVTEDQAATMLSPDYKPGQTRVGVSAEDDAQKRDVWWEQLREVLALPITDETLNANIIKDRLHDAFVYFDATHVGGDEKRLTDGFWGIMSILRDYTLQTPAQLIEFVRNAEPENRRRVIADQDILNKLDALGSIDSLYPQGAQQDHAADKEAILRGLKVHQVLSGYVISKGNPVSISAWQTMVRGMPAGGGDAGGGGDALTAIKRNQYECIGLWNRAKVPVAQEQDEDQPNPAVEAFYAKATETVQGIREQLNGEISDEQKTELNRILEMILRMDFDIRGMRDIPAAQAQASLVNYVPKESRLLVSTEEEQQKKEAFDAKILQILSKPLSQDAKQELKTVLQQMQFYYNLTGLPEGQQRTGERTAFADKALAVLAGQEFPTDYAGLVDDLDLVETREDFDAYIKLPANSKLYEQWVFLKKQEAFLPDDRKNLVRQDKLALIGSVNLGMLLYPCVMGDVQPELADYGNSLFARVMALDVVATQLREAEKSGHAGGIGNLVPGDRFAPVQGEDGEVYIIIAYANNVMKRWKELIREKRLLKERQPLARYNPPADFTTDIKDLIRACDDYFTVDAQQTRVVAGQEVEMILTADEVAAEMNRKNESPVGRQLRRLQQQAVMADFAIHGNETVNREQAGGLLPLYRQDGGQIRYDLEGGAQEEPAAQGQNANQPQGQEEPESVDNVITRLLEKPISSSAFMEALRGETSTGRVLNQLTGMRQPNGGYPQNMAGPNAVLRDIYELFSRNLNSTLEEFGEQRMAQILYEDNASLVYRKVFLGNLIGFYIRRHGDEASKTYWQEHFRSTEVAVNQLREKKAGLHAVKKGIRKLHRSLWELLLSKPCRLAAFMATFGSFKDDMEGLVAEMRNEDGQMPEGLEAVDEIVDLGKQLFDGGEGDKLSILNHIAEFLRGQSLAVQKSLFGPFFHKLSHLRKYLEAQGTGDYASHDEAVLLVRTPLLFGKIFQYYIKQKGSADANVLLDDVLNNNLLALQIEEDGENDEEDNVNYEEIPEDNGENNGNPPPQQEAPHQEQQEDDWEMLDPPPRQEDEENEENEPRYIVPGGHLQEPARKKIGQMYFVKQNANALMASHDGRQYNGQVIENEEYRRWFYNGVRSLRRSVDEFKGKLREINDNDYDQKAAEADRILQEAIMADLKIHGYDITPGQATQLIQYYMAANYSRYEAAKAAIRRLPRFANY